MTGSFDLSSRAPGAHEQRLEPHDSLDDFPTPPWATRALVESALGYRREEEPFQSTDPVDQTVYEPASNRGYMAKTLKEYFGIVRTSDVFDYSYDPRTVMVQDSVRDFLWPDLPAVIEAQGVDWIVTNPPYRLAQQFILRAIELAPRQGVAIFGRLGLLEGQERHREIWSRYRNVTVYPFAERVNIFKGQVSPDTAKPMAHAWYIWRPPFEESDDCPDIRVRHIAPCRKRLERPGDYEPMRLRGLPEAAE